MSAPRRPETDHGSIPSPAFLNAPAFMRCDVDGTKKSLPAVDEQITVSPIVSTTLASDLEWHVIHTGKELGPLSLAELVERTGNGGIVADDLVKQTAGRWQKAADIHFLHQQLAQHKSREEARQAALDTLGRFHGIWISKRTLEISGWVLLVLVSFGSMWAITKSTRSDPQHSQQVVAGTGRKVSKSLREIVKVERPVPVELDDKSARVEEFKKGLRIGMTHVEASALIGLPIEDKIDVYIQGDYIPEFKLVVNDAFAFISRYFPYEVPGVQKPRYRVNLLFVNARLSEYYFRSPK